MGKWIIIWGGIALVAWLVSMVISASQKAAAHKHVKKAKELLAGGNWETAAGL